MEFGCCTYKGAEDKGAEDKGATGWAIVDWEKAKPEIKLNTQETKKCSQNISWNY
jgi:hypothetical protein